MNRLLGIIICTLFSTCGVNGTIDKREAFRQLRLDTSIMPAIEHFSLLVNRDSLQNSINSPVLLHVLVSDHESSRPFCTITATRQHEQYAQARIIGETECNGFRIIFHTRSFSFAHRVLKGVNMRKTDYKEISNYEMPPEIEDYSYAKNLYMVWFNINENASLQYEFILARSPSEMREWGVDSEMTSCKYYNTE